MSAGRYWLPVFLMSLCQLIITVDLSSAGMVLPQVSRDFAIPASLLSWVVSAYALVNAGCLVLGGRMTDIFGQRRCLAASLSLFIAAEMLAALSTNFTTLVCARAGVGLASSVLGPASFSLINTEIAPGAPRHRALGFFGLMQGVALLVGLVVAGPITEWAGWRGVFWMPIPFAISGLVLTFRGVRPAATAAVRRIGNTAGAVLIAIGVALLIYGLSTLADSQVVSRDVILSLAAGCAAVALFMALERSSADPLIPRVIVTRRSFSWGCIANTAAISGTGPIFIMANLYMIEALHFSAGTAGLGMIPLAAAGLLAGNIGPIWMRYWSLRAVSAGALAIALLGLLVFTAAAPQGHYAATVGVGGFITLLGMNLAIMSLMGDATAEAPEDLQGTASGIVIMCQTLGYPIGVATALAAFARSDSSTHLAEGFQHAFISMVGFVTLGLCVVVFATGVRKRAADTAAATS